MIAVIATTAIVTIVSMVAGISVAVSLDLLAAHRRRRQRAATRPSRKG